MQSNLAKSYGDWVRSVRDMKNFGFVTLNDGSCFKDLQVVMNRENLWQLMRRFFVALAALIIQGVLEFTLIAHSLLSYRRRPL